MSQRLQVCQISPARLYHGQRENFGIFIHEGDNVLGNDLATGGFVNIQIKAALFMSVDPGKDGIGEVGVHNDGICAGLQFRISHGKGGETFCHILFEDNFIGIGVDQISYIFFGLLPFSQQIGLDAVIIGGDIVIHKSAAGILDSLGGHADKTMVQIYMVTDVPELAIN